MCSSLIKSDKNISELSSEKKLYDLFETNGQITFKLTMKIYKVLY